MMPTNELVTAAPDTCWGMVDGHLLLFDPVTRRLHVLNDTAAMIWALTDEGTNVGDLVVRVGQEYRAAPSEIEAEVIDVVDHLVDLRVCLSGSVDAPRQYPTLGSVPHVQIVPTASMLGPYEVLGTEVYIDVRDRDLRAELLRVLAPLRRTRRAIGGGLCYRVEIIENLCQVSVNGRVLARGSDRAAALRTLLSDLNITPLETVEDAIVFHAGAVEIAGRVVVLPGESDTGKSTLVAQLVERGHAYVTDEALVVDSFDLDVRPHPKSLCIDSGSQEILRHLEPPANPVRDRTWDIDPASIGAGRVSTGGEIAAFVFSTYQPGADTAMRPLHPIDVMPRLLANSFSIPPLDQIGFAAMIRLANDVPAFELLHGGEGHIELVEATVAAEPTINL